MITVGMDHDSPIRSHPTPFHKTQSRICVHLR